MADKKWKMPAWMEPLRGWIVNAGGNRIEDMVNGNADPYVNLPLSTLQACVKSEVALLTNLHEHALLLEFKPKRKAGRRRPRRRRR